tara:strand:+ start:4741 stop:5049 length:309 start_codon:yes stop_codon:yes gene_type:complete
MHIGHVMLVDVFCNAVGNVVAFYDRDSLQSGSMRSAGQWLTEPCPDMPPGEICLKLYVHAIGFQKSDKAVHTCFSGCDFPVAAHEPRSGSFVCRGITEMVRN